MEEESPKSEGEGVVFVWFVARARLFCFDSVLLFRNKQTSIKMRLRRGGLYRVQCLGRIYGRKEQGVGEVGYQIGRIAVFFLI